MIDFINKIKQFFKNIFSKNKIKMLDVPKESDTKQKNNPKGKKEFFEMYNKVKNETIDLQEIEKEDLLKIRKLLREESKIQDKKLKSEINQLEIIKEVY